MKESFTNKNGVLIVKNLIIEIQENKQYLSDIDGLIGDGDHGINMNKGFSMCQEKLNEDNDINLTDSLKILSNILMLKIGGSMGPLYGYFFNSMAQTLENHDIIDKYLINNMLQQIPLKLSKITKAKPGDKTLMDTLIPAVESYTCGIESGQEFPELLKNMKLAAENGRDSTKDLVSKIGRSSRLGERSKGVIDAGAASCCLILCSMADSIIELIKE